MEINSKPILLKRFIADGFDISCLFVLFMLLNFLLSNTVLFNNYRIHYENYKSIEQEVINNNDSAERINEILNSNEEYQNEVFAATLHSYLARCVIGILLESILFLLIPLIDKDKLTLGKRLTGILLFDESRQSKANNLQIVIRFIFIVITSTSLYPWTGIYTFLLFPVLRFIVLILNKKNKTVCDYISRTMYIEKLSHSSI